MRIKPTKENLRNWIDIYVPERDLFFITKEVLNEINISDVLVMPIVEFFKHSTYNQINYVNSYLYWNIKNSDYVIVAEKSWIGSISDKVRKIIFKSQIKSGRGLIIPISFVDNLEKIPTTYLINKNIIIQRAMWEQLDTRVKEQILIRELYESWDSGDCEELPSNLLIHLKPFSNTFSNEQGANCLSSVLYAVSKGTHEWLIYEWVHQNTFIESLKRHGYDVYLGEEKQKDDVIVWQDDYGVVQHAAYYLGNNLYFNKDGQTIFNPWKLIKENQLYKDWGHLTSIKYRQVITTPK